MSPGQCNHFWTYVRVCLSCIVLAAVVKWLLLHSIWSSSVSHSLKTPSARDAMCTLKHYVLCWEHSVPKSFRLRFSKTPCVFQFLHEVLFDSPHHTVSLTPHYFYNQTIDICLDGALVSISVNLSS